MCKWGKTKKVWVIKENHKVEVDKCMAPLIKVLNKYGIETLASDCGHGKSEKSSVIFSSKNIRLRLGASKAHLEFPYQGKK